MIFISVSVLTVCCLDSGLVTVLPDSVYSRLNLSAMSYNAASVNPR